MAVLSNDKGPMVFSRLRFRVMETVYSKNGGARETSHKSFTYESLLGAG